MSDTQALLAEIAKLQAAQDAAGLKGLEDHADKKVRKAARKAIHVLRSKGVDIPDQGRTWAGAGLQDMRRHAGVVANLDMDASPGVTRLTLSIPDETEGAKLYVALIDPNDRMLNFAAYFQTDGQQSRMARDWVRDANERSVDAQWVRARMLWSREETRRANFDLPGSFDEHLATISADGSTPDARPDVAWLDAALDGVEAGDVDVSGVLIEGGVHTWPLMFDAASLFERLTEKMEGVETDSLTDGDRLAHITAACESDEPLREALAGPFTRALSDVAIELWLAGKTAEAARVRQLVRDIEGSEQPESVDGVVNLVQLQITAAAMEQMRRGGGLDNPDHGHAGHVHGPDCDH